MGGFGGARPGTPVDLGSGERERVVYRRFVFILVVAGVIVVEDEADLGKKPGAGWSPGNVGTRGLESGQTIGCCDSPVALIRGAFD